MEPNDGHAAAEEEGGEDEQGDDDGEDEEGFEVGSALELADVVAGALVGAFEAEGFGVGFLLVRAAPVRRLDGGRVGDVGEVGEDGVRVHGAVVDGLLEGDHAVGCLAGFVGALAEGVWCAFRLRGEVDDGAFFVWEMCFGRALQEGGDCCCLDVVA